MLARGRREGAMALSATAEEAQSSFLAAVICLPVFLLLRFAFPAPAMVVADPVRAVVADLIAYVAYWAGFALASLALAEAMGRRALWPRFIAAWNWTNVVQYAVLAVLTLPAAFGLPGSLAEALGLFGIGYAIWLQWFTTRAALGLPGASAVAFVALDLGIAVFLSGLAAHMGAG
jgi:hypothetical protein